MKTKNMIESEIFRKDTVDNALAANPFAAIGDVVLHALEEAILTSRLPEGTKLNISKISEALNVSPTPVRNAIDKLTEDGLIRVRAGEEDRYKNYYVFELSPKEMEDLFVARKSIEGMAAYLCAARPWALDLERLETLAGGFYEGMKQFASIDVSRRPANKDNSLDREFHHLIINGSDNQYLIAAYQSVEKKIQYLSIRAVSYNLKEPKDNLIKMGAQHMAICNAIRSGYTNAARQLMEEHIDYCMVSCLRNQHKGKGNIG